MQGAEYQRHQFANLAEHEETFGGHPGLPTHGHSGRLCHYGTAAQPRPAAHRSTNGTHCHTINWHSVGGTAASTTRNNIFPCTAGTPSAYTETGTVCAGTTTVISTADVARANSR